MMSHDAVYSLSIMKESWFGHQTSELFLHEYFGAEARYPAVWDTQAQNREG